MLNTKSVSVRASRQVALALLSLAFALPQGAFAADSLVDNSPFIPMGWKPPQPRQPNKPPVRPAPVTPIQRVLKFQGVYQLGGEFRFNIFNVKESKSTWVKLNTPGGTYRVHSYDAKRGSIRLSFEGRTEELSLVEANENPIQVTQAAQPAPRAPASNAAQNKQPAGNTPNPNSGNKRSADAQQLISALSKSGQMPTASSVNISSGNLGGSSASTQAQQGNTAAVTGGAGASIPAIITSGAGSGTTINVGTQGGNTGSTGEAVTTGAGPRRIARRRITQQ